MKNCILLLWISLVLIGCHHPQPGIIVEPLQVFSDSTLLSPQRIPFRFEPKIPLISIAAVGDIMVGNHTAYYIKKYGTDYPFDSTRAIISSAHIGFGNLEAPFTTGGTKFEKKFNFKVPPEHAIGLVNAGFDVVNLANNHMLDYGIEGLESTLAILDSIGLAHCGAGMTREQAQQPAILTRNGYRIAFLGYSMTFPEEFWATHRHGGTSYPYRIKKDIQHSDSLADFVVVTFHWGREGMNYPREYQKVFAHQAIDYGADLVLGHHPHVLQGLEIYKNRLIAYSLGNFSFSSYSRKATESMILHARLTDTGLLFARIVPISVNNLAIAFQPRLLRGAAADSVIAHVRQYSRPLNSTDIIDENGYIWGGTVTRGDSLLAQKKNSLMPSGSN